MNVVWEQSINGVLLTPNTGSQDIITPPRPVFFEELDLLGFNKFWKYPRTEEPLLWAIRRKYYYKGEYVAKVKRGAAQIVVHKKAYNLKLQPVDVDYLIQVNKMALLQLENEAIDFINYVYRLYKEKQSLFIVSYSGGKDAQVVLDLTSRIIPPDEFMVVFLDTTMEIPYTYENVRKSQEKYPNVKFYITKPEKQAIKLWEERGVPSRIDRWCHKLLKMKPFIKLVKTLLREKRKAVVFQGTRAEESASRAKYHRLSDSKKYSFQIHAEPILYWNTTEVFLYLLYRKLPINKGYRCGLTRIGCSVCPFHSVWSQLIITQLQKCNFISIPFIQTLKQLADNSQLQVPAYYPFVYKEWKTKYIPLKKRKEGL